MGPKQAIYKAQKTILAIRSDRVRGARELTHEALGAIELLAQAVSGSGAVVRRHAGACLGRLQRAQPAMAPLIKLADAARTEFKKPCAAERLAALAADWRERQRTAPDRISDLLFLRLRRCSRAATYSRSSTVLEALRRCRQRGLKTGWVLSQGEPAMEGVLAARELGAMRYSVILTTDAGLSGLLEGVDCLLLGADAVLPGRALINKAGTHALAREAARLGLPVLVVCETFKILPRRLQPFLRLPRRGVSFDSTPWRLLTEIITEEGSSSR